LKRRRDEGVAEAELGRRSGEFLPSLDAELLIDSLFGPIYYRLLLKTAPLTEAYADQLIAQALHGQRGTPKANLSKKATGLRRKSSRSS
jgi:hypothetical protein